MVNKYIVIASSVLATLLSTASAVDLDALLLLPGVESHDGSNTVFSNSDFYQTSFVESIAPAIVNSSVIFHDMSRGVVIGNVKSRVSVSNEDTYYDWVQYQMVRSGDWGTEWSPVSDCIWRDEKDKSDDTPNKFPISVPFSWTSEYSIVDYDKDANDDGLDMGLIKSLLNKKNWHQMNETVSESSIMVAPMIKPYNVVQLWYRKHMIWADVQKQTCSGSHDSLSVACSAWSKYYRVDAPASDEPIASYMTKMLEDEVQCPNVENRTTSERLHLDMEVPESKSFWTSLKDKLFSKK
ncbi:hypothetical protein SEUBUCD646_0C00270 [Saccharomyces eubayanus]|uniref:Uncharacterized protein n=1 Tax=Saccharomyces eubayanus TaxID=1080349 RepID=A0ABN8VPM1_SACEU|nr:hypothetical protein SEUBUCD650_0C00270 [Saccharomyces eubayanus]CAI1902507.1 hypothetical protein SEUBUCD646_0C00270 [Saccharomyces eubayanus]